MFRKKFSIRGTDCQYLLWLVVTVTVCSLSSMSSIHCHSGGGGVVDDVIGYYCLPLFHIMTKRLCFGELGPHLKGKVSICAHWGVKGDGKERRFF